MLKVHHRGFLYFPFCLKEQKHQKASFHTAVHRVGAKYFSLCITNYLFYLILPYSHNLSKLANTYTVKLVKKNAKDSIIVDVNTSKSQEKLTHNMILKFKE